MQQPFLIVFISVLCFSLVFSEVKSQEHTLSYDELMSLPISQLGVNNVSNTMPPIETTKVLSVINVEPENENDTEVTDAESESVSALIKAMSFGSIIKKVLVNGWQYFQIKAGVLKNMILTKGKALPENLFNKAKNYVDDIKGTPAQIDQLFQEFRKDGILKVIKHYRTQNLQKVGAFGLIKVTTENVGGKQIVKFSTAEFTKHMAINLFKDLAAKEAEDLAKDFAKEYAEHVFASVVNDEVESETKKFDAIQKIKDFFIPTDLCWKDSYGRGVGSIPQVCPSSHPQQGGLLCYKQCPTGAVRDMHACKTGCKPGYLTHPLTCHLPLHVLWQCGGNCQNGYHRTSVCTCAQGPDTYGRLLHGEYSAPAIKVCSSNLQQDAGLCYNYCHNGYYGVGPVCWKKCPRDAPHFCGALCTKNAAICDKKIAELVMTGLSFVVNCAIGNVGSAALDAASAITDLASIPVCPADKPGEIPTIPISEQKCTEKNIKGVTVGLCCKDGNCELNGLKYKGKTFFAKTLLDFQQLKEVKSCEEKMKCWWARKCTKSKRECRSSKSVNTCNNKQVCSNKRICENQRICKRGKCRNVRKCRNQRTCRNQRSCGNKRICKKWGSICLSYGPKYWRCTRSKVCKNKVVKK